MIRFFTLLGLFGYMTQAQADTLMLQYTKISQGNVVSQQKIACQNGCEFTPNQRSLGTVVMNNPRDYKFKIEEQEPTGLRVVKAHLQPNRTISIVDSEHNEHLLTLSDGI